jgi:hypothetical protein
VVACGKGAWYVQRALSRRNLRRSGLLAVAATPVLLAACGGGGRQDANEPSGTFPVQVLSATFPTFQRLAQHTQLSLTLKNSGQKTIPNIAVTILNPADGTAAQAFSRLITASPQQGLASRSRPIWIVDSPPGPCEYSCRLGGPGSAVTAYSNTWALGKLAPGQTVKFAWGLTAVASGHFRLEYQVAAGLNGKAKAVNAQGAQPTGTFSVNITQQPQSAYVNNAGQVVTKP